MFPPKPDGPTDKYTDGRMDIRTDISIYRVASLLIILEVISTVESTFQVLFHGDF